MKIKVCLSGEEESELEVEWVTVENEHGDTEIHIYENNLGQCVWEIG